MFGYGSSVLAFNPFVVVKTLTIILRYAGEIHTRT